MKWKRGKVHFGSLLGHLAKKLPILGHRQAFFRMRTFAIQSAAFAQKKKDIESKKKAATSGKSTVTNKPKSAAVSKNDPEQMKMF